MLVSLDADRPRAIYRLHTAGYCSISDAEGGPGWGRAVLRPPLNPHHQQAGTKEKMKPIKVTPKQAKAWQRKLPVSKDSLGGCPDVSQGSLQGEPADSLRGKIDTGENPFGPGGPAGCATHELSHPIACPVCDALTLRMIAELDGTKVRPWVCPACYRARRWARKRKR